MEKPEDQQKPGNTIKVKARVHKKGDPKTPFYKKARFKFQLVEVSKEKGVCLNWPEKENSTDGFDLKIEPKTNDLLKVAGDGQSAESAAGLNESTVTITSHDWGAYGKIKVTVVFDDGSFDTAHVQGDKSKQALTIPKDDNGNHIADFWEKRYASGSSDPKADDDLWPLSDKGEGDGLSLYEEYRGFRVQGKHIFTSPIEKDIFVRDANSLTIGYFGQSGLTVHLIKRKEYGEESGARNPRVINFNRGFATRGPQHVLYLVNAKLPGNLNGIALGTEEPGPPKTKSVMLIDAAKCRVFSEQQLKSTIAHELAHGCSVSHHGEDDYDISQFEYLQHGTWRNIGDTGGASFRVSVQGGQESGVMTCIMRYNLADFYETPNGPNRWVKRDGTLQNGNDYPQKEPAGTIFCNDKKGTGVAGNATLGKCKSQFCVNDNKH